MAVEKKQELKALPARRIGVRELANVRVVKMIAPICPIDDNPTNQKLVGGEVVEVPNPAFTGETNCQTEFAGARGWWMECSKRGHDPYFRKRFITLEEPEYELQDDGSELVVGTRVKRIRQTTPNLTPVPAYTRLHSGRAPALFHETKGYRFLPELGYAELCEFRNCELPVTKKTRYGKFCAERHARLIGADVEAVMLEASPTKRQEKERQLKAIDISPLDDGGVLLQQPPSLDVEDAPRMES